MFSRTYTNIYGENVAGDGSTSVEKRFLEVVGRPVSEVEVAAVEAGGSFDWTPGTPQREGNISGPGPSWLVIAGLAAVFFYLRRKKK